MQQSQLPASPDLAHLKKQAKQLLRDAHAGVPLAVARFAASLPAVRALGPASLALSQLHLHDAQSVIARELGLRSWTELKRLVEWKAADNADRLHTWLRWVYDGNARDRRLAARMLHDEPDFFRADPWLACATGDVPALRDAIAADPAWVNRPGGPRHLPPLVAVTHSHLVLEPAFEQPLLAAAELLLAHGADPDSSWTNPQRPDTPLSALYGAAGRTHHPAMLRLLLAAGASPDDNESLYHSVEGPDSTCTHLLLEAGARVTGTNAIGRALDYGRLDDLALLLRHGGDPREGTPLHHAILRGRSIAHIQLLIAAGADLHATNRAGISLFHWAEMHGRTDVVDLLRNAGVSVPALTPEQQFIAACARADEPAARALPQPTPDAIPGVLARLTPDQLRTLPELADTGNLPAVQTMLNLGWPIETTAAWTATPLHLAVYRGDAAMADLLLRHGARWQTINGFGGDVFGTLSHSSGTDPEDPTAPRDYLGCARTLIAHGAPVPDPAAHTFSPEVTSYFDTLRLRSPPMGTAPAYPKASERR